MTMERAMILLAAAGAAYYLWRQAQVAPAGVGAPASAFVAGDPASMVTDAGTSLGGVLQANADEFRAMLARLGF